MQATTSRAWTELTAVQAGTVSVTIHYSFADAEELVSAATLRFRTEDELRSSLPAAGFTIESREGDGEFLVIARAGRFDQRPRTTR